MPFTLPGVAVSTPALPSVSPLLLGDAQANICCSLGSTSMKGSSFEALFRL